MNNLGAKRRTPDPRDFNLGKIQYAASIPPVLLPDDSWILSVRNYQGQTPTCGAHGSTHLKMIQDYTGSNLPHYTPRFSWIEIKILDGIPLEDGTDMRWIFKAAQNNGYCDFPLLGNNVNLPLAAYSDPSVLVANNIVPDGRTHLINSYAFGNADYESICQGIAQNKAVALLIECDDGFWGTAKPTFTTPTYGHFIVADGYDENGIRVIDSAEPNIEMAIKYVAKEYITPDFFIEMGTIVDLT